MPPNDQRFSRDRRTRRCRNFLIRLRVFVGGKRFLDRRLAGPFRWGAESSLMVT